MRMARERLGAFDVRVWSAGSGSPLLYLHGYEQHPGAAAFLTALARTHEVRAPEHPGYGESTGFEQLYDVIDVALYYRRLIESWNKGPVDVVGHSLGGMFAAELAALSPHLVRRLVLVDAYGLWLDDSPMPDPFALSSKDLESAKWCDPAKAPIPEPPLWKPALTAGRRRFFARRTSGRRPSSCGRFLTMDSGVGSPTSKPRR